MEETNDYLYQRFKPSSELTFAQLIPIRLAKIFSDAEVNWMKKIKMGEYSIDYNTLLETIEAACKDGSIQDTYVTMPLTDVD